MYECIHAINRKQGKRGLCGIKLDMHKAYDIVEWGFLEIMLKMGFDARWVSLIISCVTSVRYIARFNSLEIGIFTPTRGIRQGERS